MATEAQMEVLSTALTSALLARATVERGIISADAIRAEIHATNVLLDACIDAGMDPHESSHEGWAAERVGAWLLAA